MSRSGYDQDLDDWSLIRWRGAVKSALRGKRGQAFLREMLAVLDAMPVKALIKSELIDGVGGVCAMGAVCGARGLREVDPEDPEEAALALGIAVALAREIAFENDECGPSEWTGRPETPEQRWIRMREWAAGQISKEKADG